jgi:hypothetical protein
VGLELPILGKIQQRGNVAGNSAPDYAVSRVKDLLLTLLHLAVWTAKLCGPGGVRAVIAENLLLKQQLIVLRRARHRAPNLTVGDRLLCGFGPLFLSPGRIQNAAIALCPSTLLAFHQALVRRKYRRLFSSTLVSACVGRSPRLRHGFAPIPRPSRRASFCRPDQ